MIVRAMTTAAARGPLDRGCVPGLFRQPGDWDENKINSAYLILGEVDGSGAGCGRCHWI
jgi:hypothetical protein